MANDRILKAQVAEIFQPLLSAQRYKMAKGGRGSGKSHFFAGNMIMEHIRVKTDSVCLREVQESLKFSSKKLLESKISEYNAGDYFDVQDQCIKDKNGGIIIFQGMKDHTAESIKSLEGFRIAWFAEAQSASKKSLSLLRPTLRTGSELWFDWNPFKEDDPIEELQDLLMKSESPPIVVTANWKDNPWLPNDLKVEMAIDAKGDKDLFDHIWDGKTLKNTEGDYFKKQLAQVNAEKRICFIPRLGVPVNTFWDIGNSDGCAIWFHQQVGLEDRFIGYYEGHGEDLEFYYKELQTRGYVYNKHFLPHDADHERLSIKNKSVKMMLQDLGCQNVQIVPRIADLNTGILQTRKHFASAFFESDSDGVNGCKLGVKRLTNYRKRYNSVDNRWIDEPDKKNGCSEGADAFRMWAQAKEGGMITMAGRARKVQVEQDFDGGWMG
jgi:phage terminase large subunit